MDANNLNSDNSDRQNTTPPKSGWELKYLIDQLKSNPVFMLPLAIIIIVIVLVVVLGDMLFAQF